MNKVLEIYNLLLKNYGAQGWWPLLSIKGVNPTKTGAVKGYHPKDYSLPKTNTQRFEICLGAILTQNTAWPNVETAISNLKKLNTINPKNLLSLDEEKLKTAIRPAGYFNQKSKKLKIFSQFYLELKGRTPTREELLNIWGVGPETADSILLYAYHQPVFVVDAYTKRVFSRMGLIRKDETYDDFQLFFHKNLKKDYELFNEYHALIVEHAKRYCKNNPSCKDCPVSSACNKRI